MITPEFKNNIRKAINLLVGANGPLANQQILNLFTENGIDKNDAMEIFFFLPIAFIRSLLPNQNWPDTYIDFYEKDNKVERKYEESNIFQTVWKETQEYISTCSDKKHVLKIASISAEFNAINHILLANPQMQPADVSISKNVFIR